jgi:hypothetical protein
MNRKAVTGNNAGIGVLVQMKRSIRYEKSCNLSEAPSSLSISVPGQEILGSRLPSLPQLVVESLHEP